MMEDELYYWNELSDYKGEGLPFLFEIKIINGREEYYLSSSNENKYERYTFSDNGDFISRNHVSQHEILNIIKDNFIDYWSENVNVIASIESSELLHSNYCTHTLYVETTYDNTLKMLLQTLADLEYYYESDDNDSVTKYTFHDSFVDKILNTDTDNFKTVAYMFRIEYKEGWPGCTIKVENIPLMISKLEKLKTPIYSWLHKKIVQVPCIVTFEFDIKSHFSFGNSVIERFVNPFMLKLSDSNIKSVLLPDCKL